MYIHLLDLGMGRLDAEGGKLFFDGRAGVHGGQTFPYPVFGRFTHSLSALDGHYLKMFLGRFGLLVISVHIRQAVREQPDTGYRKSLSPMDASPGFGCFFFGFLEF
jgi:hypothetical protein